MKKAILYDLVARIMAEEVKHKLARVRKTNLTAGELIAELSKISPDPIISIDRRPPSEAGYKWWGCELTHADDRHCVLSITKYEGS